MKKIVIGIDPDIDKNGIAVKSKDEFTLHNWRFFELFDNLKALDREQIVLVIIEGGWLNKGNWHKQEKGSASINTKIGQHTGANHETGKKIAEMMEYLGLPYKIVKPTQTKVNAKLFKMITKYEGRTNQEQRDAYMLIHGLK